MNTRVSAGSDRTCRIDVGGYRLSVSTQGASAPPVIFVSGIWVDEPGDNHDVDPGQEWIGTTALVTEPTLMIRYDRSGVGRSDELPADRRAGGAEASAGELAQLLATLAINDPVVLVAQSIGGLIAEHYARAHPDRVAGMVLLDPTPEHFYDVIGGGHPTIVEGRGGRIFDKLTDPRAEQVHPTFPQMPVVLIASAVGRWLATPDAFNNYDTPLAEIDTCWQRWQREKAVQLRGAHVVAHSAGHAIHVDAPALVARALEGVVRAARTGTAVWLDPEALHAAGGALSTG